jgi:hypothetical protein
MNWVDAILYTVLYAYAAIGTGYMIRRVTKTFRA